MPLDLEAWIEQEEYHCRYLEGVVYGRHQILRKLEALLKEAHENETLDSVGERNEEPHNEVGEMDLRGVGAQFSNISEHSDPLINNKDYSVSVGGHVGIENANSRSED